MLVDGAHMLGQAPVDVSSMHADYFATNCHKWLCSARGSAVLWVAYDAQAEFTPLVKSHGHGSGFTSDFIWSGVLQSACIPVSCCFQFLSVHQGTSHRSGLRKRTNCID